MTDFEKDISKMFGLVFAIPMICIVMAAWFVFHTEKHEVLEEKWVTVYVQEIDNRPKHFYLDLKDAETGEIYDHVYVSKHYNDWRKVQFYKEFKVWRIKKKMLNQENQPIHYSFNNVYEGVKSVTTD